MERISARRLELKSALAEAEAALFDAVANAGGVDFDPTDANAKVVKARVRCRQLHAALVELNRAELIAASRESIHAGVELWDEAPRRALAETRRSRQPGAHLFPRDARPRPSILRQGFGLLTLALAYLLYFHIDVQLQILRLPSNVYHQASATLVSVADGRHLTRILN